MFDELMIVGGIFWSLTYIFVIMRGFKDKTFGMPFVALCANISWEAIFSFVHPHLQPQIYIDYIWFALDCIIVFQFLKHGISEFDFSKKKLYLLFSIITIAACFVIYYTCNILDDWQGVYVAFGQNLVMSVLFIAMITSRNSLKGQSFYIAIFKMIGTGISSVAFYLYQPISHQTIVLPVFYVSTFACDVIYTILVYQKCKKQNISCLKVL
ncbi:MAG: hypothetical protein ACREA5_06910 [Nitrosotalea sp.]